MDRYVIAGTLTESFPDFEPVRDMERRLEVLDQWVRRETSTDRLFLLMPLPRRFALSPRLHPHILEIQDFHQTVRLLLMHRPSSLSDLTSRIQSSVETLGEGLPELSYPFRRFRGFALRTFPRLLHPTHPERLLEDAHLRREITDEILDLLFMGELEEDFLQSLVLELERSHGGVTRPQGVEGPPGMGKTLLLKKLAVHLRERGWNVLYVDLRHMSGDRHRPILERLAQAAAKTLNLRLNPTDIRHLARWMREGPGGFILLDGVEYLVWKEPPDWILRTLLRTRWRPVISGRDNTLRNLEVADALPMDPSSMEEALVWINRLKDWSSDKVLHEWGPWFASLELEVTPGWILLAIEFYERYGPQSREAFFAWVLKRRIRDVLERRGLWDESALEPFFWSILRALSLVLTPPLRYTEEPLPIFEGVPWEETPLGHPALWDTPVDQGGITPLGYLRSRTNKEEDAHQLLQEILVEIFLEDGFLTLWWNHEGETEREWVRAESGTFATFAGGAGASFWATLDDVGRFIQTWPLFKNRFSNWDPLYWVRAYLWALEQRGRLDPDALKETLFEFWWKKGTALWGRELATCIPREQMLEWLASTAREQPQAFPFRLLGLLYLFPDLQSSLPSILPLEVLPFLHRYREYAPPAVESVGEILNKWYADSAPAILRFFQDHPEVFGRIFEEDFPEPAGFFTLRETVRENPNPAPDLNEKDPDREAFGLWLRFVQVRDPLALKRLLRQEEKRVLRLMGSTPHRRALLNALLDLTAKFPEEVLAFFQHHRNSLFQNASFARDFGIWFQEALKLRMFEGTVEAMEDFMIRLPRGQTSRVHFVCALLPSALMLAEQRVPNPFVDQLLETWKTDVIRSLWVLRRQRLTSKYLEIKQALENRFPQFWKELSRVLSSRGRLAKHLPLFLNPEKLARGISIAYPSPEDPSRLRDPWEVELPGMEDRFLSKLKVALAKADFPSHPSGWEPTGWDRLERILREIEELERMLEGEQTGDLYEGAPSLIYGQRFFKEISPSSPPEEDKPFQQVFQCIQEAGEQFRAFENQHPWKGAGWFPESFVQENQDGENESERQARQRAFSALQRMVALLERHPEKLEEVLPLLPFGEIRLRLRARSWLSSLPSAPPEAPASSGSAAGSLPPLSVRFEKLDDTASVEGETSIFFVSPDRKGKRYGVWKVVASWTENTSSGAHVTLFAPGGERSQAEFERVQSMLRRVMVRPRPGLKLYFVPVWSESENLKDPDLSFEDPLALSAMALAVAVALEGARRDISPG